MDTLVGIAVAIGLVSFVIAINIYVKDEPESKDIWDRW